MPARNPKLHAHSAPKGYHLRGVSTLLDGKGKVTAQWVKTARTPMTPEDLASVYRDAAKLITPAKKLPTPRVEASDELCAVIPLGDPHLGMLAWHRESGKNWDTKISVKAHTDVVGRLLASIPNVSVCVLANLGDMIHADSSKAQTAAGTQVDVDSRYPKVIRAAVAMMCNLVEMAAQKATQVVVENVVGNHDTQSAVMLAEIMRAHFRNDPRVVIRENMRAHSYMHFGANMFGFHHGHRTKAADLPLLMAADQPELWGQTTTRKWFCGHVHHLRAEEYPGATVEYYGTLAPQDAWHAGQGYRARQSARVELYHQTEGLKTRHEVVL